MAIYQGSSGNDTIYPWTVGPNVVIVGSTLPPQDHVYDYLYGNGGSDHLDGGLGADYMEGGDGGDRYVVNHVDDKVVELRNDDLGVIDSVSTSVSYTLPFGVEWLYMNGDVQAMNGTGNALDNSIWGNNGVNILNGKAGADYMDGGDGADTYYVDNIGDVVDEDSSSHPGDKIFSTVSYTIADDVEKLTLQGSADINATGDNEVDDVDLLVGNRGRNVLTGGLGIDKLNGNAGDDVFDFNLVEESNGAARDRIMSFEFGTSTTGDRIDVSEIDANVSLSGEQTFKWGGTATKSEGYLWVEDAGSGNTMVKGNIDGDAEAEFQVAVNDGSIMANSWGVDDFIL